MKSLCSFKIQRKEQVYFAILVVISLIFYAAIGAFLVISDLSYKLIALAYVLFFAALQWVFQLFFIGHIKGNGIQINERQFPEAYEISQGSIRKTGT